MDLLDREAADSSSDHELETLSESIHTSDEEFINDNGEEGEVSSSEDEEAAPNPYVSIYNIKPQT